MKTNDQAFENLKEWQTATEVMIGSKLKLLRTNNGLEFLSQRFANYCKEMGISRHLSVKYTPHQNGVAEIMKRTLLERVRCVLLNAGLPKSFWGEAVTL